VRGAPRFQRLPLGSLLAFEAAARLGSFKLAALERSVTPAAISHQVKALEASLGTLLFVRLNRALRLTAAGQRLADSCSKCFSEMELELHSLRHEGRIGSAATVSISAAPTIATKWLAPRLQHFLAKHPLVEVRLNAENEMRSPRRDPHVDLALRYGPGPYEDDPGAEPLWDYGQVVPVCAPGLLASYPAPPGEIMSRTLLRVELPAVRGSVASADWNSWFRAADVPLDRIADKARNGPLFGNHNLAIEAAANGRGLVLAPVILVMEDMRAGRLVAASDLLLEDPNRFWILYERSRARPSVRAFVDWLRGEARLSAEEMSAPAVLHRGGGKAGGQTRVSASAAPKRRIAERRADMIGCSRSRGNDSGGD